NSHSNRRLFIIGGNHTMESHGSGLRRVLLLSFCVAGIWAAYIYQGVLQETLSTKRFGEDEKRFEHLAFLNLAQNVVCLVWSFIMIKLWSNGGSGGAPWWTYWSAGITNTIGPAMGIEALKYISYPAQVLAKSSKMIPVMLMGSLVYGIRYTLPEYLCTFLVAGGVSMFALLKTSSKTISKLANPNAPLGYGLCFLNLAFDGFTNATQDSITARYPKTSAWDIMLGMNLWGTIYNMVYMFGLPHGSGFEAVQFCKQHPEAAWDILMYCLCGAVGQNFIFLTISRFGSLANTTITTTRKFVSIVVSSVLSGNPLSSKQWGCVSMVFENCGLGMPCARVLYQAMVVDPELYSELAGESWRLVREPRIPLSLGGTLTVTTHHLLSRKMSCYKERLRSGIVDIKKDEAVALFQTMIVSRPLPTVIDFSKLFSGIAKTKQYDLVLALCKQMEMNGIAHDLYTLSIVINCFCRRRKLGFAFSVFGKMLKLGYDPGTVTFSTLINGLCLKGRVSEAVELVDRMVEMKVIPNLIILNTLVNGLCLQDRVSEAVALIDRMVANGCQPDQFTYGPILNRMCKSGNTASALDLLRKMEDRKVKPQVVTYNIIIDSLCKDGSLHDALSLFNQMETKGIKPNVFTYTSLIGGFCNAGRWDDGAQLLRDMISREITPDVITFSALIDSFVKEGKLTEAKELYNEMIVRGLDPNTITYGSLIHGLCMENRLDEANQMLDLMVSKGCDPDIWTYNILINGYCKAKLVDEGMRLFRKMSLRGVVADTVTYSSLIQGFCQSGKLKVAKELFQEMVSQGVHPNIVTYKILMDGFRVDEAWDLFCSLPLKEVKPDVKTYTIMIGGLCKKGSMSKAGLLFKKMGEDGIAPDDCTWNTLIRAHLRGGDLATSAKLIEEMKSCGFSADASTIKIVMDMLSDGRMKKSFLDLLS
ncbi:unnamed protein product, partial [Brassica rapa]